MPVTDPDFNPSKDPVVDKIKRDVLALEHYIVTNVPPGVRRDHAIKVLEDFSMWAVKATTCGDD